jgi:hypothetical protein
METSESKKLRQAIRAGVFDTDPDAFSKAVNSVYALERAAEREAAWQAYQLGVVNLCAVETE